VFEHLFEKVRTHLSERDLYVFDSFVVADADAYGAKARELAALFQSDFSQCEDMVSPKVRAAGLKLD